MDAPIERVRLDDVSQEFWGNMILFRLAMALGIPRDENGDITVDADDVLEAAEEHIRAWTDDRCFSTDITLTTADVVYEGRVPYGLSTEHLTDEL